jgi:rhomboid protease GluP
MAFGISPKFVTEKKLNSLSKEEFLVISIETAKKLKWNVGYIHEKGFIANTKVSMSSWTEEVSIKIEEEFASIKSQCNGSQIFDWGKNKKNVENFASTFEEVKSLLSSEDLAIKFEELKLEFADEEILNQNNETSPNQITSFFDVFIPKKGFYITPILINVNIVIYILMVVTGVNFMLPDNQSLINWGANFRPVTLEGEPWRLITNCFIHIGIFHLLMNVYALLYIGLLLEPYLGKARFLAAYLITGVIASIASLWWHDLTISAGASGAIFGMYGIFLAMLTTNLIEKSTRKALLTSIAIFVGYNMLNGFKANSGIDNAAHIGGLISGWIVGYAYVLSLKKPQNINLKNGIIVGFSIVTIIGAIFFYFLLPNDIGKYDTRIKEFVALEEKALGLYRLPENSDNETYLDEIRRNGIPSWEANIELLNSFKHMDLPADIKKRNDFLLEYCELRVKCYETIYKAIVQNTEEFQAQIENYNQQIEAKIDEISNGI